MTGRRYCLITPCRDEAAHAVQTLQCVLAQTVAPALWLIVDDGSTDQTPQILAEYAAQTPFIKVLRRENRGYRFLGGGVIDAFYHGYDTINPGDFDYICKFDLDLDVPPRYFQRMIEMMEADPRLGTISGKPFFVNARGQKVAERCGDENSVGMVKFYRTACFEQIGGFVRYLMWDGIDGHRCRMLGWIARSIDDPDTRFAHLRPMGTSHKNWWTGRVRHGVGQYYMGTHPLYLLASAFTRIFHPPYFIGSAAMIWGYFASMLRQARRYEDVEFRKFLRSWQLQALLHGKSRATARLDQRQAAKWKPQPRAALPTVAG